MLKSNKKLSDYNNSRLVSNSPLKSNGAGIKKGKNVINRVSVVQKERNEIYFPLRDQYFLEHPVCEFPGCNSTELTLHHRAGRIGDLLFDTRYFMSVCTLHHNYIENNIKESLEKGWIIKTN